MRNYYNLKNKKMKQVKPALEQFQPGKNQLEPALDQFYQPGKNQVKPGYAVKFRTGKTRQKPACQTSNASFVEKTSLEHTD